MATFYPVGGGAPGIDPSVLTATAGDVVAGAVAGVKDNYNPVTGTLALTGNAQSNHVLSGETYYTTNPKSKLTGTMTVQSILSFSSAPYSASQIIFTWQNPSIGPFSGVIIVGKTGGYPANINDGTRYYKGFGNNSDANGISSVIIGGFGVNVTYYFRVFSYTTVNNEEWTSNTTLVSYTIISQQILTFTSNTTWTVPSNVNYIDIFCVGGGGGGGSGDYGSSGVRCGGGGGGGYTNTQLSVPVSPNTSINIVVGAGGAPATNGGSTYITINGNNYCVANGGERGQSGFSTISGRGGNGGSGGGGSASFRTSLPAYGYPAGNGGSNGSNGGSSDGGGGGGTGQNSTTYSFNGVLYSGGGGGGGYQPPASARGFGGSGGGGNGADAMGNSGSAGSPNTGGGGGGGYGTSNSNGNRIGYSGGSGICLIRYVE